MIGSFKGRYAEAIAAGRTPRGFPAELVRSAQRKLAALIAATELQSLGSPPGNRLEALKGDRRGQHSIGSMINGASVSAGRRDKPKRLKLSTITDRPPIRILPPVHPGEYLAEEYLSPMQFTPYALAQKLGVPRTRIERLCRGETSVTPDTALRLARYFRTTPDFWMNLQSLYDLTIAEQQAGKDIAAIQPVRAA